MATATSAWAKPGAWALESEEHAAMEKGDISSAFPSLTNAASEPSVDFPSLASAAASKSSKKKKQQVLSLAEFAGGKPVSHGAAARSRPADALSSSYSKGLTTDELLLLPTGPRERSAEELERSSRGFNYSTYGNGGARRADGSASRVSGDELRKNSLNRDSGPSRADEVDDWGSMKRSAGPPERRDRGGGFFDTQSRADEVDSWVSKRGSAPPADGLRERRGGFEMFSKDRSAMGGADSDSWGRKKEEIVRADSDTWGRKRDGVSRTDSDSWGRKEEANGTAGGRPRLVLQPRTVPLANGNTDGHGELNQGEKHASIVNSKGSNPFGLACPREEVLAEKGHDWKKLDDKGLMTLLQEERVVAWVMEVCLRIALREVGGRKLHLMLLLQCLVF
ncbi:eukaryotic translation initiation factor 4B3 [Phalaenopsis equestris]|uniref:eukaryotic translation initiation factor 4B3 n=1 Tax=Phalaenopsis equestris TaxID=78828 RepID=UPI0009E6222A|nr:eukaryotic translation initiation factor 4B3 [Phalaenopsis equestris]